MADRPTPFQPPMVRALLAGTKTQTRRGMSLRRFRGFTEFGPSDTPGYDWHFRDRQMRWHDFRHADLLAELPVKVGDRLWVGEALRREETDQGVPYKVYTADGDQPEHVAAGWHWKVKALAGRYCAKVYSRITLHVTEVRVQRLQEIDRDDAKAEGIPEFWHDAAKIGLPRADEDGGHVWDNHTSVENYRMLWEAINGPGSWDANPWVAAYTFTVERANIEHARAA